MRLRSFSVFASFLALAGFAQAGGIDLVPGGTLNSIPQTFVAPGSSLDSRTDILTGIDQSINLLTYEAELRSAVYRNADGTLSFAYSLYSFYPGNTNIDRLSIPGLAAYTTRVEQEAARPADGFLASGGVSRSANGDIVTFLFQGNGEANTGAIEPFAGAVYQIVHTNAVDYTLGSLASRGANGVPASALAFVPTGDPVPEPATLAALSLGAAAVVRRRHRR